MGFLIIGGCQPAQPAVQRAPEQPLAIGRYQMARGDTDLTVVVLDTVEGTLTNCVNSGGQFRCVEQAR